MKSKFFEHYILSDEECVKSIWGDAILVFDTNVLLNLYRYSENSKNDLLKALEYYKDRLWIPFQIGWEYHNNRLSVIMDIHTAYEQITTNLEKETIEFIKKLNLSKYKRHPKIDVEWFEKQIRTSVKSLCDHLEEMKESCTNYFQNDEINNKITELFDEKVGDDFNESELKDIYKEGQNRYNEKIPPGYCDLKEKKDSGNRRLYGDLIWWKQVIKEAKEKQVNVILVTDDTKEDWYEKIKGKTFGPRKELLREFHEETNKNILIYPCNRFLEYAKENMDIEIDQETISEIDEIRKEDEAIKDLISHLPSEDEKIYNIFSENPWMSANYINDTYIRSIINPLNLIDNYKDALGKTTVNPIEGLVSPDTKYSDLLGKKQENYFTGISGLSADYSGVLGKTTVNPIEGLVSPATKYTDLLGKKQENYLTGISGLSADYSGVLGKTTVNPIEGLVSPATKYTDLLGKKQENYLTGISGLSADYPGILGKTTVNPIDGLISPVTKYADILGNKSVNQIGGLSAISNVYSNVLGKTDVNPIERLTRLSKNIGINSFSDHKDKKSQSDDTDI